MFQKIIFLILSFWTFHLNSQTQLNFPKNPLNPQNPKEPTLYVPKEKEEKKNSETPKEEKEKRTLKIKVKLIFCNQNSLEGFWYPKFETISFHHTHKKISYFKNLSLTKIKSITFMRWQFQLLKKKKEGIQYEVLPDQVQIISKNNIAFILKKEIPKKLSNLTIYNEYGITNQFSYWIDVKYKNKTWFSKLPKISGNYRTECFAPVIKKIIFLNEEQK